MFVLRWPRRQRLLAEDREHKTPDLEYQMELITRVNNSFDFHQPVNVTFNFADLLYLPGQVEKAT